MKQYLKKHGIRYFKNFPSDSICPVCKKNDNDLCILVGIDGTSDDHIEEALPVHLRCALVSRINKKSMIMYKIV